MLKGPSLGTWQPSSRGRAHVIESFHDPLLPTHPYRSVSGPPDRRGSGLGGLLSGWWSGGSSAGEPDAPGVQGLHYLRERLIAWPYDVPGESACDGHLLQDYMRSAQARISRESWAGVEPPLMPLALGSSFAWAPAWKSSPQVLRVLRVVVGAPRVLPGSFPSQPAPLLGLILPALLVQPPTWQPLPPSASSTVPARLDAVGCHVVKPSSQGALPRLLPLPRQGLEEGKGTTAGCRAGQIAPVPTCCPGQPAAQYLWSTFERTLDMLGPEAVCWDVPPGKRTATSYRVSVRPAIAHQGVDACPYCCLCRRADWR